MGKEEAEEQERLATAKEAEESRLKDERRIAAKELLETEARLTKQARLAEEKLINKEKECGTLHVGPEKVIERDFLKSNESKVFEEIALYSEKVKANVDVNRKQPIDQSQRQDLSSKAQVRPIVICGPSGVGKGSSSICAPAYGAKICWMQRPSA